MTIRRIGKLVTFIAGIAFIALAVMLVVTNLKIIPNILEEYQDINFLKLRITSILLLALVAFIAGFGAFLSGFTGNCGLWFIFHLTCLIATLAYYLVTHRETDNFNGASKAFFIVGLIFWVIYVAGFNILRYAQRKEKYQEN